MRKETICEGVHNFFVCLELVPIILYNFLAVWLPANLRIKKATKIFNQKLSETNLPSKVIESLTKKYASMKDRVFDDILNKKDKTQTQSVKTNDSDKFKNILLKTLPGSQTYLKRKRGSRDGLNGVVVLDATKAVILTVGIFRALERDVYWVLVCIVSYGLYSSFFGLASELINKNKASTKGLKGSVMKTLGQVLSDTKVIAIVGLALSSHCIFGAPYIPYYHRIEGLDLVEHYISGFGVGLFAIKAYRIFVTHVSYTNVLTFYGLNELSQMVKSFEVKAELPFVLYSSLGTGLIWEAMEELTENLSPRIVNVFFWNGVMDVFMDILGALTAYLLVSRSFIIKKETPENGLEKNAKLTRGALRSVSREVPALIKTVIDNIYSKGSAKKTATAVGASYTNSATM